MKIDRKDTEIPLNRNPFRQPWMQGVRSPEVNPGRRHTVSLRGPYSKAPIERAKPGYGSTQLNSINNSNQAIRLRLLRPERFHVAD
jgi:hypothetical protein